MAENEPDSTLDPSSVIVEVVTVKLEPTFSDDENDPREPVLQPLEEVLVKKENEEAEHTTAAEQLALPVVAKHDPDYMENQSLVTEDVLETSSQTTSNTGKSTAPAASTVGRNECHICGRTLATTSGLARHIADHARPTFPCPLCPRQFLRQDILEKHRVSVHEKPDAYPCEKCEKKFKSKSNLHQHMKIHLGIKPFSCEVCGKAFPVQCHLRMHRESGKCKEPSSLVCEVCNKHYEKESQFRIHMKTHEADRIFQCDVCEMSFKSKSTLTRHILVHNGLKPYKCKYCNKAFTSSGLMKPHLRKHTGEKPYQCSVCLKQFKHKQNMQRHILRHNKVKNLVCEICHKKFPRESRLKYHMRTHLLDKRPFKCQCCHKSYSHRQNIQRHYKKKHPNETYDSKQTDASVASVIWEALLKQKKETEKDYILPDDPEDDSGSSSNNVKN